MSLGFEQEDGSLIARMALAHPIHPYCHIDSRSRNRRRNLLVDVFLPGELCSRPEALCVIYIYICKYIYIYIYIYIRMHYLYKFCYRTYIDIQQECRSDLVTFVFVLNIILTLGIWRSAISHLPGWFCHWTFFQNVAFNMVPLDTYYVTFSYSTWIFCWLSLRRMLSWINH